MLHVMCMKGLLYIYIYHSDTISGINVLNLEPAEPLAPSVWPQLRNGEKFITLFTCQSCKRHSANIDTCTFSMYGKHFYQMVDILTNTTASYQWVYVVYCWQKISNLSCAIIDNLFLWLICVNNYFTRYTVVDLYSIDKWHYGLNFQAKQFE